MDAILAVLLLCLVTIALGLNVVALAMTVQELARLRRGVA